jgi:hypothetical protein
MTNQCIFKGLKRYVLFSSTGNIYSLIWSKLYWVLLSLYCKSGVFCVTFTSSRLKSAKKKSEQNQTKPQQSPGNTHKKRFFFYCSNQRIAIKSASNRYIARIKAKNLSLVSQEIYGVFYWSQEEEVCTRLMQWTDPGISRTILKRCSSPRRNVYWTDTNGTAIDTCLSAV